MSMKVFATADLHLGMKFSTFDDMGPELSEARYTALRRCVEAANEEHCELLVIAGDLFDRQNVSATDITKTAALLSGFAGSALLILPGNHDFFTGIDGKPWGEFVRAMESTSVPVLLLSDTRRYELDHFDLPVTVFPAPCTQKHSDTDNISWITDASGKSESDESRLTLGLAHGSVEGQSFDKEGRYYPMTLAQLDHAPVDLWIIGHSHRRFPEEGMVKPRLFIPGTPEPDGFDCRHQGGALIIEIDGKEVVSYRRIDTGTYSFYDIQAAIEEAATINAAVSIEKPDRSLISLTLTGALSKHEYEKLPSVLEGLKSQYIYLRADIGNLQEIVNKDAVDQEFAAGSFPHRLLTAFLAEADLEAAQIAYRLFQEA